VVSSPQLVPNGPRTLTRSPGRDRHRVRLTAPTSRIV
jgi:hypothetical protein